MLCYFLLIIIFKKNILQMNTTSQVPQQIPAHSLFVISPSIIPNKVVLGRDLTASANPANRPSFAGKEHFVAKPVGHRKK